MNTTTPQPNPVTAAVVRVKTTRFGMIEVEEDLIITLPDGMIGFEDCKRYVVLTPSEDSLFKWFQCLDDGAVAFPIINPWTFRPDYAPTISEEDVCALGLTAEQPKLVFAVVTIPRNNPRGATANLLGPIVINPLTRIGKQVIVTDEDYSTRHRIIAEMERAA
ncbi:MAG TPA: flagellar assembly protein FliW [Chthonomonadales bacterium]|nr:flagellar assembly protein FliW [Chthonomonadales bacterium]